MSRCHPAFPFRRALVPVVLLSLAASGCSGDGKVFEEPRTQGAVSSAPTPEGAGGHGRQLFRIEPDQVRRGTLVRIPWNAKLPDGSSVEWLINGQVVPGDNALTLDTGRLQKGDTLQARALWKGGIGLSQIVTVQDSLPEVRGFRFVPEQGPPGIPLGVEAETYDADGDRVELKIAWMKNGEPAGTGRQLGVAVKRGDRVAVTITPFDGEAEGRAVTLNREIRNSPPVIEGQEQFGVGDNVVTFHVRASDADGDPLRFTLKDAPPGMRIDPGTGWVRWQTDPGAIGKIPFTVVASDGAGGEATARFTVTIQAEPVSGSR